jgi:hypothetical protein
MAHEIHGMIRSEVLEEKALTLVDACAPVEEQRLKRFSIFWALAVVLLSPLLFPPVLAMYGGLVITMTQQTEGAWVYAGLLLFALGICFHLDRLTRGRLNDNVARVESALSARAAAATGSEPVALILRSFRSDVAHSDSAAEFSLCEIIEPALRESGYRPVALGRNLHLLPRHGVAFIETGDETWWEIFTEIATGAAVIVAFPQDTPSLRRELAWLAAQGMVGKLALVMAPESLPVIYAPTGDVPSAGPAADDLKRMQVWSEFRRIGAEDLGVELPGYDSRGALILFAPNGAVSVCPLRTQFETPRWFAAQMARDYRERYGVDFHAIWRDAVGRRSWQGPPVCDLWRRLAPAPLHIDYHAYLRPPGAVGLEWRELKMTMAVGWGAALGVLLGGAVVVVWRMF